MDTAPGVASDLERVLNRQFETAWKLTQFHLDGLTTEECLWRPSPIGPHVRRLPDGRWQADWPEREDYEAGAPSVAWLTWHVGFWWSMTLDHSFGTAALKREDIWWPGDAAAVRAWIERLRNEWQHALAALAAADLAKSERTRWPFRDRPFADVIAWVSVELTKNAAEIGYARFLYATKTR